MLIKRGDFYWASLDPIRGSEQAGRRPVLVIQNNIGNEMAPTTIVAPLTTKSFLKGYPTNVNLPKGSAGIPSDSTILLSQIRTLDKTRFEKQIGSLTPTLMQKVDRAIKISLGL